MIWGAFRQSTLPVDFRLLLSSLRSPTPGLHSCCFPYKLPPINCFQLLWKLWKKEFSSKMIFFKGRASYCSPGWAGTQYVMQAVLKLEVILLSAGMIGVHHHT